MRRDAAVTRRQLPVEWVLLECGCALAGIARPKQPFRFSAQHVVDRNRCDVMAHCIDFSLAFAEDRAE